jgi:hypothetical protein
MADMSYTAAGFERRNGIPFRQNHTSVNHATGESPFGEDSRNCEHENMTITDLAPIPMTEIWRGPFWRASTPVTRWSMETGQTQRQFKANLVSGAIHATITAQNNLIWGISV